MKILKPMLFGPLLMSAIMTANAADFTEGKISYNILSESEKTVTVVASAQKYSGAIVIPAKVTNNGNEYTVTAISDRAFNECVSLTSVSFPNTLTTVGSYAFEMCGALAKLEFPANITSIGEYSFQGCRNLTTLVLPEKLTAVSNGLLVSCDALESLVIPASVTRIGDWAFNYASALTAIELPDAVKSIGEGAFYGCYALTSLNLGKNVETISNNAFGECSELTSIDLPASIKSIGNNVFTNCEKLAAINVEEGCTIMASYHGAVFTPDLKELRFGPPAIKEVVVPDECEKINAYAFAYGKVEKVTGCKNLLVIDEYAFTGCKRLTYIELGNKLTTLADDALSTTAIEYITLPESLTSMGNRAFENCGELKSIVIPDKVPEIGNYCFFNCMSLESATWGKGVRSMGEYAFRNCPNLTSMICKPISPVRIYDETYFDKDQYSTIHVYVPANSLNAYRNADVWKLFNISAMSEASITLETVNVDETSATVSGKPSDNNVYWYAGVETLAKYEGESIWSTLVAKWKAEGEGWYATYCENSHKGEATHTFNGLRPNTTYAAYAFAVDSEGKLVIPVATVTFLTTEDVNDLSISISNVTAQSAQVTVSPTDNNTFWYVDVVNKADFNGDNEWSELVSAWKTEDDNWYETYCGKAHKGELTQTFSDLNEKSDYVAFAFAVDSNGEILMPQVSKEFTTLDSGLESVVSDSAAVNVNGNTVTISGSYTAAQAYSTDGRHAATFNGGGAELAPGMYIVRIQGAGSQSAVKIIVR